MSMPRITCRCLSYGFLSNVLIKNSQKSGYFRLYFGTSIFQNTQKIFSRRVSSHDAKYGNRIGLENGQRKVAAVIAAIVGVAGGVAFINSNRLHAADVVEAGSPINGLPNYTTDQVRRHNNKNDRIWMTYKNGVYDVTEYIGDHPGGLSIMLSAGVSLKPFFATYDLHYHDFVLKKLESLRIGNIYDNIDEASEEINYYSGEPQRNTEYRPHTTKPFNIEYPLSHINGSFLTPNERFFIRNHFSVPEISEHDYRLHVCKGHSSKSLSLSLGYLKNQFPKKTVVSTLQCVENRRREMRNVKRLFGIKWDNGAIGNAKWTGACLDDVLKHAGIDLERESIAHIQFEGFDRDPSGAPYTASVPVELIRRFKQEIILAYEMNDEEISRDHGYPIRVILPGFSGARQVKWLQRIKLIESETPYHWQNHYKPFPPSATWKDANFSILPAIQDMPVQASIYKPLNEYRVKPGERDLEVSGYAWSGGGRGILSVELSTDGGKTWQEADLQKPDQSYGKTFAWTLWNAVVRIPDDAKDKMEIVCRAIDSSLNSQPETVEEVWNFCGVLNNAWHRVTVYLSERN